MKTKITAIIAILAASVFAFAETNTEVAKVAPEKQVQAVQARQIKVRPQISPEMREAFVQRVLLSLSEENLAKLAERVAAIQKMTPEQKTEARKALPKPEFNKKADGKKCEVRKFEGRKFDNCKFEGKRGQGYSAHHGYYKMKMMKREMMRRHFMKNHHSGMKCCPCAGGAQKAPAPAPVTK